jgi:hypothetical protein
MHKKQFHQHTLIANQIFITANDMSYPMKAETWAKLPGNSTLIGEPRTKKFSCPN